MSNFDDEYRDVRRRLDRKAAEFVWHDAERDLNKLREFAEQHSPDGAFRFIEDIESPADGDADGHHRIRISPVTVRWQRWLEAKYDRDTAWIILGSCQQRRG